MIFQLSALIISVILVHLVYQTVIRPNAEAVLESNAAQAAVDKDYVQERSLYVVVKDYEQESCFILLFWALAIMGMKTRSAFYEKNLLDKDFINIHGGMNILPQDTRTYIRPLQALSDKEQMGLLPRALSAALNRFASTENVQDVSEAVKSVCEGESDRLDSELSMIRYIAWAIPSIGFIGTVRGIGAALGQAHEAIAGDIAGVTSSLGVAFNSTFIALLISMVVMFFMHQLQLSQERLVLDSQSYCENNLLRFLKAK